MTTFLQDVLALILVLAVYLVGFLLWDLYAARKRSDKNDD